MKKIIYIILSLVMLASCNKAAIYTTKPSTIDIEFGDKAISSTYIMAHLTPSNSRSYYYAGVVTQNTFDQITDENHFMQLCVDSLYMEYINWRYSLLVSSVKYIANFANHCLSYGEDSRYFKNLKSETKYVLYAFCVNPETNQSIGQLYSKPFTTTAIKKSNLTFQALFKERPDGAYLSIVPSDDNQNFVWNWVDNEELEREKLTVEEYAERLKRTYKELGKEEFLYSKGAQSFRCTGDDLIVYHKYHIIAIGYDGDWTTKVFSAEFEYPFATEGPIDLK